MNHLLRKNLIFFSPSSCSPRALLIRLQFCEFSSTSTSSSHSPSHQPHWRRQEEESRNVRVSVWWDFENCNVPNGVNISKVAPAVTEAVRANGIKGPVHITAFGDVLQLSRANQEALVYTGIHLTHIPNGGKNSADRSLLIDLLYWVSQNPPPAHLFLISGDKDFAGILHRLRMNNYNILLASPGKASDVLCSAATIMWQWSSLLKGEDLTGKHFNHPPDGLFGSWYGSSKVPLQNPFSAAELSASSQNVEINKPSSDVKLGPIPNSVVRKIRNILNSHPNGISISDLRVELTKDVRLDKNLYGYKKFSQLLLSIPQISDGNFLVRLVSPESPAPCESIQLSSTTSVVKNEERGYAATPELNGEGKNMDRYAHVPLYERSMGDDSKSLHPAASQGKPIREYMNGKSSSSFVERHVLQPLNEVQKSPSLDIKKVVDVANAPLSDIQLPPKDSEVSKTKAGSFKRPKPLSENVTVGSDDASPEILEKYTNSGNRSAGDNHTTEENNDIANHEAGKFNTKRHVLQPLNEVQKSPSLDIKKVVDVANAPLSDIQLPPKDSEVSKTKAGSFKRPKPLSENVTVGSDDASPEILEKYTNSGNRSAGDNHTTEENNDIANHEAGKFNTKSNYESPTRKEVDEVCHPDSSPAVDDSVEKRPDGNAETYRKSSTFFSWIRSWWPFRKSSANSNDLTANQNEVVSNSEDLGETNSEDLGETNSEVLGETNSEDLGETNSEDLGETNSEDLGETKSSDPDHDVSHSGKPELFSSGSFWNDMESFVFTPKGSLLLSQSKSREDLAHKLQKHGPVVLRSLSEKEIFQLVELLITEKKWLEESPSQAVFPFRLTQPVQKSSSGSCQSQGANGLRSLFLNKPSQSNLQKSSEHDADKHNQIIHRTRVSIPANGMKYTERSRDDILADCQKLVRDILREYPNGYNLGSFRRLFVERYGYHLDIQKLGYKKLASLVQLMPEVKLESTFIFPAVPASDTETSILQSQVTNASHASSNSDNELYDSVPKDDSVESPWDELGPISATNSDQKDKESNLSQKANERVTLKHFDYEPVDIDCDSSDSDEDSSLTKPKPKCNELDSSLWQVLESWEADKGRENSVKKADTVDSLGNSLAHILKSSTESTKGTLSKIPPGNFREKQRSQMNYSFVADPVVSDKDKLIGGLLDGFKKADEPKMQN